MAAATPALRRRGLAGAGAGPTTHRPPRRPLRPALLPARAPARAGRGRAVAEGRAEAEADAADEAVETVAVGLGARSYPIYIGAGLLAAERPFLRRHLAGKQVRRAAGPGSRGLAPKPSGKRSPPRRDLPPGRLLRAPRRSPARTRRTAG